MSSANLEYTDKILQGDVIEQLQKLPGEFVDCVVTSPPYWGLRDYGVEGQIGLEEQPKEYINKIVSVFDEIKRVLKPTGTVFLNIGDTYYGAMRFTAKYASGIINQWRPDTPLRKNLPKTNWLQPKQKLLIPERIAIEMQEHGWILRNHIIWYKPNHLPSSVQDRLTGSYESVFFFTKSQRYYFNLDAIREESHTVPWTIKASNKATKGNDPRQHYAGKYNELIAEKVNSPRARLATREVVNFYNPKGKNPGDVWSLTTEQSKVSHFAVMPMKLVRQCLKCGCDKDGLVLDPFAGSGTTLYVARKMALHYLGIELKPEYVELAKARLAKIPARLDSFMQPMEVCIK